MRSMDSSFYGKIKTNHLVVFSITKESNILADNFVLKYLMIIVLWVASGSCLWIFCLVVINSKTSCETFMKISTRQSKIKDGILTLGIVLFHDKAIVANDTQDLVGSLDGNLLSYLT